MRAKKYECRKMHQENEQLAKIAWRLCVRASTDSQYCNVSESCLASRNSLAVRARLTQRAHAHAVAVRSPAIEGHPSPAPRASAPELKDNLSLRSCFTTSLDDRYAVYRVGVACGDILRNRASRSQLFARRSPASTRRPAATMSRSRVVARRHASSNRR